MSTVTKRDIENTGTISIKSFADMADENPVSEHHLELQLKMATSSMNHEYARMEYDDTRDRERKQELLEFMHDCRMQYFEAREGLVVHDPYALLDFEMDLLRQKQTIVTQYHA